MVEKIVGESCTSIDDGEKIFKLIEPELIKGSTVEVDFKNIILVLTPFLNASFGKLLQEFGKEKIMTKVSMKNTVDEILKQINEFIYRKDAELSQSSDQETLQEMFDEDDLTDTSL